MNTFILTAAMMLGADPTPAPPPITVEQHQKLVVIRDNIDTMRRLEVQLGKPDFFKRIIAEQLAEADALSSGRIKTYDDLYANTGAENVAPTPWEQFRGLMTFTNIIIVFGVILAGSAFIWLFGHYFLDLIRMVPAQAWEVVLWTGFTGIAYSATAVVPDWQLAVLMPAAFGFLGATILTCNLHGGDSRAYEWPSLLLAVVWGVMAVAFQSHVIGFMSVMAMLTALGFICGHFPGCVYMGFESDRVIPRTTLAAGLMLAVHILLVITGAAATEIAPFREGMSFMGSFVYFLGVLIMADKYYCRVRGDVNWGLYWLMQALVLTSGVGALYLGAVFGLTALTAFGGTFFALYILEKYYDLPWYGIGWAWSLLGLGGLLYGIGVFAKSHPQYFLFGG
jgi:hypothetical protein